MGPRLVTCVQVGDILYCLADCRGRLRPVADSRGGRPPIGWMHLKTSENFAPNAWFLHKIFKNFLRRGQNALPRPHSTLPPPSIPNFWIRRWLRLHKNGFTGRLCTMPFIASAVVLLQSTRIMACLLCYISACYILCYMLYIVIAEASVSVCHSMALHQNLGSRNHHGWAWAATKFERFVTKF